MIKIFTDIDIVHKLWGKVDLPAILNIDFLKVYYKKHSHIKHLFFLDDNMRLYAHIFKLNFSKTNNYLRNISLTNIFLRFFSLDVLYLTNSFITNIPSFINNKPINFNKLLNTIKYNYSLIIIPDFLFENIKFENNNYTKIEVEEEMVIDINSRWNVLEDYMSDLKKKYRYKVKRIIKEASVLEIRNLDSDDLEKYALDIKKLFTQVVKSSQFEGPVFNTSSFTLFINQGFMRVDGYFLHNKLVGFSSEMQQKKDLYSYYVGFDKYLNNSLPIYGRIIIENIKNAIHLKKKRLVLGRTANEYKTNFGAVAYKSYIYLIITNRLLHNILRSFLSKIRIKKWKQRSPFINRKHII